MKTTPVSRAKTDFSLLVDAAENGEPTTITRRGKPVAVLAPVEAALSLYEQEKPSFYEFLRTFPGGIGLERDQTPMREIDL